jgi:tetratricopeptide (TPR) repeat protein
MDYMQLFDSKYWLVLVGVAVIIAGCKSSGAALDEFDNQIQQQPTEVSRSSNSAETSAKATATNRDPVIVNYRNKSSNIQIILDPNQDEFFLDLSGMAPSDKDSIVVVDSALVKNRAKDIQSLLSSFRKAQDLFYLGEYRDALAEVDKTIEIQETADAYALKGTIFFMLENPTAARANWNRAVQLDPNIPVPSIPELETLINEIREDGDQ